MKICLHLISFVRKTGKEQREIPEFGRRRANYFGPVTSVPEVTNFFCNKVDLPRV